MAVIYNMSHEFCVASVTPSSLVEEAVFLRFLLVDVAVFPHLLGEGLQFSGQLAKDLRGDGLCVALFSIRAHACFRLPRLRLRVRTLDHWGLYERLHARAQIFVHVARPLDREADGTPARAHVVDELHLRFVVEYLLREVAPCGRHPGRRACSTSTRRGRNCCCS